MRSILLSGESSPHSSFWHFCARLHKERISIVLWAGGALLKENADLVGHYCSRVLVSLEGNPPIHDLIHGAAGAAVELANGVTALKDVEPNIPVSPHSAVQQLNCGKLVEMTAYADSPGGVEQFERPSSVAAATVNTTGSSTNQTTFVSDRSHRGSPC
ncbi:MAG: hypothetical protein ACRD1R_15930 [Acidobacteriota bacterium]